MKGMTTKKAIAIFAPCISAVVAIMLAVIIAASVFWQDISLWLYGRAQTADAQALTAGTELCEDIVEQGVVLLKNNTDEDGKAALPLSANEIKKVNVFGWAAYDWMTSAFGSGYSNTKLEKVKLFPALKAAGIEYNEDLYNMYRDFFSDGKTVYGEQDLVEYRGGVSFGSEAIFTLHEPGKDKYTTEIRESIKDCSDVALVVIGRTGSESKDLKLEQTKQNQNNKNTFTVSDRHYLQLSTEEEEVIQVAKETCDKVIVILNTANTMETGFIDDDGIDGALLVGITGLTGVNGLINVLRGEKQAPVAERDSDGNVKYNEDGTPIYEKNADGTVKTETVKVSPSGKTADTYAYDILGTNPSTVNMGLDGAAKTYAGTTGGSSFNMYIDYNEGIYVGYKWYETADAVGYWNNRGGYKKVVQFPFGFGLSYTEFSWTVTKVEVNGRDKTSGELEKDDKISIYVEVKNIGEYPGMDIVQLYYTPQYNPGGIEKAHVNLGAFAKTGVIEPGSTDIVVLELTAQSMASYDCYDANANGHTGYELDGGEYRLRLMKNAHEEGNMSDRSVNGAAAAIDGSEIVYTVNKNGIKYDTDGTTGNTVENRFTNIGGKGNEEAIDNGDLDGSRESVPVKYLSRSDFEGTYPEKQTAAREMSAQALEVAKLTKPTDEQLAKTGYSNVEARQVTSNGKNFNDVLSASKYDDPVFEEVISNVPNNELVNLVSDGYFKTAALASISKPEFVDLDGPLGFNTRVTSGTAGCEFVAYPSATLLAQTWDPQLSYAMGLSVGRESDSMNGLKGWYAPGANTHRNPFGGRNGEYYSEDGLLSGKICAGTVKGAKDMGVYSYVKHFVVNDSELGRNGAFTFLTEQTLREIYLKPFEILIKEGGGNALMTSMNRLGRVWSGANYGLCNQIVRGEWGFNGTIVTDWINASDSYMPPYRGIWAGNDIWLSNGIGSLFSGLNDAVAYKLSEKVAHDVLWTIVDTENAAKAYDPNAERADLSKGAAYNLTWIWYIVLVELALAAGAGVMAYFLAKNIIRNKKQALAGADGAEPQTDVPTIE